MLLALLLLGSSLFGSSGLTGFFKFLIGGVWERFEVVGDGIRVIWQMGRRLMKVEYLEMRRIFDGGFRWVYWRFRRSLKVLVLF
jgi:hypothetical protein